MPIMDKAARNAYLREWRRRKLATDPDFRRRERDKDRRRRDAKNAYMRARRAEQRELQLALRPAAPPPPPTEKWVPQPICEWEPHLERNLI